MNAVVDLIRPILARCRAVTLLATSREPLGINGERVYRVPSLPVSDAVELFCELAAAADDSLTFSSTERAVIARICERLDGIPLAIELAAARSRLLTPPELLTRLDDRFRVLRRGARGGMERHQTLRATVDWSYQLLTASERLLFDRVSVFPGGFDLGSAEAVCDYGLDTLDVLSALIDKSMVIADRTEGRTRYRLLETLRQFGEERLDQRGELGPRRDRHLHHFLQVAAEADRLFQSPSERDGVETIEREWDNLRAAHSWAIATDLDAADALLWSLTLYAGFRARAELGEWVERTVAATGGRPRSPATAGIAAHWAYVAGDTQRAVRLAQTAIDQAPDLDDPATTWCWHVVTSTSDGAADPDAFEEAAAHYERSATAARVPLGVVMGLVRRIQCAAMSNEASLPELLDRLDAVATSIGSPTAEINAISARARSALATGKPHPALAGFLRCRELSHRHGVENLEASAAVGAAVASSLIGDPRTDVAFADAITRTRTEQNWGHLWRALSSAAVHLTRRGRHEPAAVLLGHLRHRHRWNLYPGDPGTDILESIDEDSAGRWTATGATMSVDDIVAFAVKSLT